MKKLTILIIALSLAAFANAAEIAWKIANISTYDTYSATTPTKIASGANYLILAIYSADTTISASFDSGAISYGDDSLVASFAPTANGGTGTGTGKKVEYTYAQGTYYYAVLYNSKGMTSVDAYDYYAVGATLTGNPVATSPDTPLQLKWTTDGKGYPAFSAVSTPEPTSGLLLLLGVAGLALKRKRA